MRPGRLLTWGEGPVQQLYQRGLAWWDGQLEMGLEVPLAPQLTFPGVGEQGVGVIFSDAARELGTGLGAFAPMRDSPSSPAEFVYAEERWSPAQQRAFDEGVVSMPFGELYGMVVFAVALLDAYPGMHSVIFFTDCDAAKAATNTGSSPSPQMNWLLAWLFKRHPHVQFLALHIAGKRNWGADGLSRDGADGATIAEVLAAVEAGEQLTVRRLRLPGDRNEAFAEAATLPQSARSQARSQRKRAGKSRRCRCKGGWSERCLLPPSGLATKLAPPLHTHRTQRGPAALFCSARW